MTFSATEQRQRGSASLELVGALPFLVIAALVAAQLVLSGAALWSAAISARAGARAALVGGSAQAAARRALPAPLRAGALVRSGRGIGVEVPVPRVLPVMPRFRVAATTGLGRGG